MKFVDISRGAAAAAQLAWEEWVARTHPTKPELVIFARRWAGMMEQRAQRDHVQVGRSAAPTMERAGGGRFSPAELREVVLVLSQAWYLGRSLLFWAEDQGIVSESDRRGGKR